MCYRRGELEGVILRFFHEDPVDMDKLPDSSHGNTGPKGQSATALPKGLLEQALLVGLGPKRRRRLERRRAQTQGQGEDNLVFVNPPPHTLVQFFVLAAPTIW